ncbi:MAG: hypothetical protein LBB25_00790 [Holosporaceae bacterium]|nr:hypothetical protein [Holosporaceae bacterium]
MICKGGTVPAQSSTPLQKMATRIPDTEAGLTLVWGALQEKGTNEP